MFSQEARDSDRMNTIAKYVNQQKIALIQDLKQTQEQLKQQQQLVKEQQQQQQQKLINNANSNVHCSRLKTSINPIS